MTSPTTGAERGPKRVQKIAILGGGPGGLSAAYHLTSPLFNPGWESRYEVTVYQLGWRLGGKGASGRNAAMNDRIEEHGIHLFGNMYSNALHMLYHAYQKVDWQPGEPITTMDQAMRQSDFQLVTDFYDETWHRLPSWLPENAETPWLGGAYASLGDIVQGLLEVMISILSGGKMPPGAGGTPTDATGGWSLEDLVKRTSNLLEGADAPDRSLLVTPLRWARSHLENDTRSLEQVGLGPILQIAEKVFVTLGGWFDKSLHELVEKSDELRWMFVQVDLLLTCFKGAIADDLLAKGIDSVDGEDYREWLTRHGASDITLAAALPQAIPNTCMQYPFGDSTVLPNMAASAFLTFVFRQLAAKGQSAYFFRVSTGETVIMPLYRLLEQRGVKFEFFTKITDLVPGTDPTGKPIVQAIEFETQAHAKSPEGYEPTRTLPDGQVVWPNQPFFDQLVEGDELERRGIDLESWWADWTGTPGRLEKGTDFDQVVVAMPIECQKHVCTKVSALSPAWQTMVEKVRSTPTQALQIWLDRSVEELGWPTLAGTNRVIGPTFATPLVAFGDFTEGIQYESWPADDPPKACIFFCGPFQPPEPMPPFCDHGFPQRALDQVRGEAAQVLRGLAGLLPNAPGDAFDKRSLDFALLHVPRKHAGAHGLGRFDLQYYRANIDPNELYTLSEPGTLRYRLKAWESGIENVTLCGDWIYTGFNIGSFEGATMGGMLAALTLAGGPTLDQVLGYDFMRPNPQGPSGPPKIPR